jgi:hypothetical protein
VRLHDRLVCHPSPAKANLQLRTLRK